MIEVASVGSEDEGGQLEWILIGVPAGNFGAGVDARVLLGQHRQRRLHMCIGFGVKDRSRKAGGRCTAQCIVSVVAVAIFKALRLCGNIEHFIP